MLSKRSAKVGPLVAPAPIRKREGFLPSSGGTSQSGPLFMYAGGASFGTSSTVAMLLNLPVRRRLNGAKQLIVFDMIEGEW